MVGTQEPTLISKIWFPGKLGQTGFGHTIKERHFENLNYDLDKLYSPENSKHINLTA